MEYLRSYSANIILFVDFEGLRGKLKQEFHAISLYQKRENAFGEGLKALKNLFGCFHMMTTKANFW